METFIIIVVVISIIHFMYEAIILPSILLNINYKFNKLKDDLILYTIENKSKISAKEFNYAVYSFESLQNNLEGFKLGTLFSIHFFIKKNPDIDKDNPLTILISNEKIKHYHDEAAKYMFYTLLSNSLMLIIYFLPLILMFLLCSSLFGKSKKSYKALIQKVSLNPESEYSNISDNGYCLHTS